MASTQGSYQHRKDEWDLQATLATKEIAQIQKQIAVANIHLQLANDDLAAHDKQIAYQQTTDEFLHSKYTNQELYESMIGQISGVYYTAYNLAFDAAQKAEQCFRHEIGNSSSPIFISPLGYFDQLKSALMAPDGLLTNIRRLESVYID